MHDDKRATNWQLPSGPMTFEQTPRLMGIVNVTPDSFSDGGKHFEPQAAVDHALRLVEEGADIIDLGGESTRPYAAKVAVEEELRRVIHVTREIGRQTSVPISIDTSKAAVAQAAIEAGAVIVNDVTALLGDSEMLRVVVDNDAAVCLMHMKGTPQTMQENPTYQDVVSEVATFLRQRRDAAVEAGVAIGRVCVDPGIGFGKRTADNLALLRNASRLHTLECPVLVGHSRKGFLGRVVEDEEADRLPAGLGVGLAMAIQGIQLLRVHDVAETRRALRLFRDCGGYDRR